MKKTLYDKIWESHIVREEPGRPPLVYIDLHLIHEVTSPQAFEGLRLMDRKVRRADRTFATVDHAIPTRDRHLPFKDCIAAEQVETLRRNCKEFGVKLYDRTGRVAGQSSTAPHIRIAMDYNAAPRSINGQHPTVLVCVGGSTAATFAPRNPTIRGGRRFG